MNRTALASSLLVFVLGCSAPQPHGPPQHAQAASPAATAASRFEPVVDLVRGTVERGTYAGVSYLVMHDGRIASEGAYGFADLDTKAPMRVDTIVRAYSMSKPFTCVATLQLVEDGKLKLDDPIAKWLPELANLQVLTGGTADAPVLEPLARPITVQNLLNHTAGFTYEFFPGPVAELYARADLWNSPSLDAFVARLAKLPLVRQPGIAFDYGVSDDVLGALIQRVSGMTFEEFLAKRITRPLHLDDTFFDVPAEKMARLATLTARKDGKLVTVPPIIGAYAEKGRGIPSGGGGLFSTLHDYARFAECLLEGGALDGTRILRRETVELALRNSLPPGVTAFDPATGWGLFSGLRLDVPSDDPTSPGTFTWSGAANTHFFADPKKHVVALFFAQHTAFDEVQIFPRFHKAVYASLE